MEEIIIPKENAVFWMDDQGYWHNRHGKFRHPKVIAYFNQSIRRDDAGYFVTQIRDGIREKVYFRYDRTPLFAVDVLKEPDLVLLLNTRAQMGLDPAGLFIMEDVLFYRYGKKDDEIVKLTSRAMLKLSEYLKEGPEGLCFEFRGHRHVISYAASE